jgi:hypothetical protein
MKQFQIKFLNRFRALKNLNVVRTKIGQGEIMKENIKTSSQESLGLFELK